MALLWTTLLDLIYPRVCELCGKKIGPELHHICWDCLAGLNYIAHPYCSVCGDPVDGQVDHAFVCFNCSETQPHFELARSAARYRGALKDLLCDFKYQHALWLRKDLVRLLISCVSVDFDLSAVDAVTYVPLYPSKQRFRSYNQARLLAEGLAKEIHKPLVYKALSRIKPTITQTNLTAKARATNVRGAFEAGKASHLEGRRILLVDDVMTTGATVNECARALKEGGAKSVFAVTVARG
jgi:ComF family protein